MLAAGVVAAASACCAQDGFRRARRAADVDDPGQQAATTAGSSFVRLRYDDGGFGGRRGGEPPWAHDYPTADMHLMKILNEMTLDAAAHRRLEHLALDDPELFNYPIAYMSEPGFWSMTDERPTGLRAYLLKGGFIIFDDFRGHDWDNLEEQMRRVLPEARWVQLDGTHPIFHSFFEIDDLITDDAAVYDERRCRPTGASSRTTIRAKRLIAIANVNNDLGEYWEFSDTGFGRST